VCAPGNPKKSSRELARNTFDAMAEAAPEAEEEDTM
jgi:hypothetical protein